MRLEMKGLEKPFAYELSLETTDSGARLTGRSWYAPPISEAESVWIPRREMKRIAALLMALADEEGS